MDMCSSKHKKNHFRELTACKQNAYTKIWYLCPILLCSLFENKSRFLITYCGNEGRSRLESVVFSGTKTRSIYQNFNCHPAALRNNVIVLSGTEFFFSIKLLSASNTFKSIFLPRNFNVFPITPSFVHILLYKLMAILANATWYN